MSCEEVKKIKPGKEFIWLSADEQYDVVVVDNGATYSSFLNKCRDWGEQKIKERLKKWKNCAHPKNNCKFKLIAFFPLEVSPRPGGNLYKVIIEDDEGQYIIGNRGIVDLETIEFKK